MRVAAFGWLHQDWFKNYFPDDMPEEWALTYYSNEFPAVVVPASYWQVETGFDSKDWLDDTHDDFRFIVQLPSQVFDGENFNPCLLQLEELVEKLDGIILPEDVPGEQLHDYLEKLSALSKLYQKTSNEPVGSVVDIWRVDHVVASSLAWFGQPLTDMRKVRGWLESIVQVNSRAAPKPEEPVVIYAPEKPDIEEMRQLRTLMEIMKL